MTDRPMADKIRSDRRPIKESRTSSGSRPGWAAMATRSPSPPPRSRASRTSSWAPSPACPRSTCTTRCSPTRTATTSCESWHRAAEGKLDPFVLVVEGSIPNEKNKSEGYWAGVRHRPGDRPADPDLRLDRPAGAARPGRWSRPAPAPPTAASTRWPATRPAAWAWPTTSAGSGSRRPACRSSACPAARCSRTTSWRRCSTCSTRRPGWRR